MSQKVSAFLRDSAWVNEILDHVRMPAVKCKFGVNTNAASLDALSLLKFILQMIPKHAGKSNN